jgi:hypothetical protein
MVADEIVYMCPICFKVCDSEEECHRHKMLACNTGEPGDERRKPLRDRFGNYVSRAPRWFLEAAHKDPGWTSHNH